MTEKLPLLSGQEIVNVLRRTLKSILRTANLTIEEFKKLI